MDSGGLPSSSMAIGWAGAYSHGRASLSLWSWLPPALSCFWAGEKAWPVSQGSPGNGPAFGSLGSSLWSSLMPLLGGRLHRPFTSKIHGSSRVHDVSVSSSTASPQTIPSLRVPNDNATTSQQPTLSKRKSRNLPHVHPLSTYYVLGTLLSAWERAMTKAKIPAIAELIF